MERESISFQNLLKGVRGERAKSYQTQKQDAQLLEQESIAKNLSKVTGVEEIPVSALKGLSLVTKKAKEKFILQSCPNVQALESIPSQYIFKAYDKTLKLKNCFDIRFLIHFQNLKGDNELKNLLNNYGHDNWSRFIAQKTIVDPNKGVITLVPCLANDSLCNLMPLLFNPETLIEWQSKGGNQYLGYIGLDNYSYLTKHLASGSNAVIIPYQLYVKYLESDRNRAAQGEELYILVYTDALKNVKRTVAKKLNIVGSMYKYQDLAGTSFTLPQSGVKEWPLQPFTALKIESNDVYSANVTYGWAANLDSSKYPEEKTSPPGTIQMPFHMIRNIWGSNFLPSTENQVSVKVTQVILPLAVRIVIQHQTKETSMFLEFISNLAQNANKQDLVTNHITPILVKYLDMQRMLLQDQHIIVPTFEFFALSQEKFSSTDPLFRSMPLVLVFKVVELYGYIITPGVLKQEVERVAVVNTSGGEHGFFNLQVLPAEENNNLTTNEYLLYMFDNTPLPLGWKHNIEHEKQEISQAKEAIESSPVGNLLTAPSLLTLKQKIDLGNSRVSPKERADWIGILRKVANTHEEMLTPRKYVAGVHVLLPDEAQTNIYRYQPFQRLWYEITGNKEPAVLDNEQMVNFLARPKTKFFAIDSDRKYVQLSGRKQVNFAQNLEKHHIFTPTPSSFQQPQPIWQQPLINPQVQSKQSTFFGKNAIENSAYETMSFILNKPEILSQIANIMSWKQEDVASAIKSTFINKPNWIVWAQNPAGEIATMHFKNYQDTLGELFFQIVLYLLNYQSLDQVDTLLGNAHHIATVENKKRQSISGVFYPIDENFTIEDILRAVGIWYKPILQDQSKENLGLDDKSAIILKAIYNEKKNEPLFISSSKRKSTPQQTLDEKKRKILKEVILIE